jgi:hypothetical protein
MDMSDDTPNDEATPSVDFLEQLRTAGDAAMPALLTRLHTAVEGGGKVTKRHRCTACGEANTIEVEVADVEEIRKLVEMFANLRIRAQAAQKGDDASVGATKLLRDRSDLPDAVLAEYIAKLKEELGIA